MRKASLNPHLASAGWAGGLLAVSSGAAYLFSTIDYPSLAQLAAVPLLPFIVAAWAIGGGPHGSGSTPLQWLMYPVAFLVWWGVIHTYLRFVPSRSRLGFPGALTLPVAWYIVVASLMFAVPRFVGNDVDPMPERTDLEEVCRIDGKWLRPFGPGTHAIAGDAARFALLGDSSQNHWLLHAQDCGLQEVMLPSTAATESIELVELTDRGEILYAVTSRGSAPLRYVLFDASTGKTRESRMPQPAQGTPNFPRFSSDGQWAAWIADPSTETERVQGGPADRLEARFAFDPSALLGRGSYHVVDVARGGGEILLEKYPREYLLVDSAGSPIKAFKLDDGVLPSLEAVRFSLDGQTYFAWDSHREQGPYTLQWRVNDRLVRKELPEHSTVFSAAVSSDWKWIAASSRANTKAGRGIEAITVWSRDGSPRFHRRLRTGANTPVVFLNGNLFAYTEVDPNWRSRTRLLRLSDAGKR